VLVPIRKRELVAVSQFEIKAAERVSFHAMDGKIFNQVPARSNGVDQRRLIPMDKPPGDKKRDPITQRSAELPLADGALHKGAGRGKGVARVEGGIAENERDTAPVAMTGTLDGSHLDATFPRSCEFR